MQRTVASGPRGAVVLSGRPLGAGRLQACHHAYGREPGETTVAAH